ncbi:MAG: hypothetical protein ACRC7O_05905 [Fimbriiglobus sp.]
MFSTSLAAAVTGLMAFGSATTGASTTPVTPAVIAQAERQLPVVKAAPVVVSGFVARYVNPPAVTVGNFVPVATAPVMLAPSATTYSTAPVVVGSPVVVGTPVYGTTVVTGNPVITGNVVYGRVISSVPAGTVTSCANGRCSVVSTPVVTSVPTPIVTSVPTPVYSTVASPVYAPVATPVYSTVTTPVRMMVLPVVSSTCPNGRCPNAR